MVRAGLLPLDDIRRTKLGDLPWSTENLLEVMGDETSILRALICEYLFVSLFRACAESLASENCESLGGDAARRQEYRRTA